MGHYTKQNGEFVARMEDILDVYAFVLDEDISLVCMDEQSVQLLKDRCDVIEMKFGCIEKEDFQLCEMGLVMFLCFLLHICLVLCGCVGVSGKVDWALRFIVW
jgi:hypothetical protein